MLNSLHVPSLAILRCFEAAAKHQSFTEAAEELGLTQGAVSRHVRELEDHVGAALFRREGRGVRLTVAGQNLATNLCSDLEGLRRTVAHAIAAGETHQLLSIAVLPTFGARWLIPRLNQFKSTHDNLELVVYSRSEPFDLIENGIDLAIHFGTDDWPGTRLTRLCREDLTVVAAPTLNSQYDLRHPAGIFEMPLLHLSSRPLLWENFRQSISDAERSTRTGSYFDQFSLIISAAVAGLGAAILPTYLIEPELASGSLIELATFPDEFGKCYYVATPAGVKNPLASQLATWIRKQARHP